MLETGEKIGELTHVLKRQESDGNVNNVNQQVRVNDVDIPLKTHIVVEIGIYNNPGQDNTRFEAKTYSDRSGFSIPRSVIRDLDLHPGHSLKVSLFERLTEEEKEGWNLSDDIDVIDRQKAFNGGSNKVDTRLYSEKSRRYVDEEGGETLLGFRNVRTGEKASGISHTEYKSEKNAIFFPKEVREEIDAEIGDLIEIIVPGETTDSDTELSQEKKIDEIYDMVSEMYDAYLENIND